MPQQSNDQFQQFFLQLQLLVSTAMRVRRSLEQGKTEEVKQALEDADTTGIATYILRVAIVQAGSEVSSIKGQFQSWMAEADNKMGRLLRGQQDSLTAQKRLALAEADLARHNSSQTSKTAKAVMNFANQSDKAFLGMVYQAWQAYTKRQQLEAMCREEYADRLKDLEDNMAKWKTGQCAKSQNMMIKKIQQDQLMLLGRIFDVWRKDTEDAAFMREHGDKLKEMEEKLANAKAAQKESASKVMAGMAANSERGLVDLVFKSWVQLRIDTIATKEQQEKRLAAESKLDEFAKGKSEEAKFVVQKMAGSSSTGLIHECWSAWVKLYDENRQEAEMAEKLAKSSAKMSGFKDRNKATSGSVMNRAGEHMTTMLLLRCFQSWRMDSSMERNMKQHQSRIDAKRSQLVGVQHMFRKFAEQLESGISQDKGSKDSARLFDQNSKGKRKLSKGDQNSVSLPEIKKPGSGRTSSRPGSQGGVATGSPGRQEAVPPPKAAWN